MENQDALGVYGDVLEGTGYLYGALGYEMDANAELGFSFKKLAKGVAKGATSVAKGAAKIAAAPAVLAARAALAIMMQAVLPLAKVICKLPPGVLQIAASSAGQRVDVVPLFCKAINVKNWSGVRRMLPAVIKIAVKAAAVSSVPGLAPALLVMKAVPGLRNLAGADLSEAGVGDPIMLLGATPESDMTAAMTLLGDDELADGLGALSKQDMGTWALILSGAVLAGLGVYAARQRPLNLPVLR